MKSGAAKVSAGIIALMFIALFIYLWAEVIVHVYTFKPAGKVQTLTLPDRQVTVLSFLATTLATGTAAVLGITIVTGSQTPLTAQNEGVKAAAGRVKAVLAGSSLLWAGLLAYLGVGVAVLITWFEKGDVAPAVVGTFGASVLGWMGGAMAAVFKAANN